MFVQDIARESNAPGTQKKRARRAILPDVSALPDVSQHLSTNRKRVLALNTLDVMSFWTEMEAPGISWKSGPRFPAAERSSWRDWHNARTQADNT